MNILSLSTLSFVATWSWKENNILQSITLGSTSCKSWKLSLPGYWCGLDKAWLMPLVWILRCFCTIAMPRRPPYLFVTGIFFTSPNDRDWLFLSWWFPSVSSNSSLQSWFWILNTRMEKDVWFFSWKKLSQTFLGFSSVGPLLDGSCIPVRMTPVGSIGHTVNEYQGARTSLWSLSEVQAADWQDGR